ncbi:AAA family ATPase [Tenacibaculum finnmarkense]|uniref:AAA family ATPase n=1 Tax=Tenacibaculum finnmarkense TaxID=2781243 RepID=UPI00187B2642|nr:AAA family ATPase [Tenacibaculum finnmarkense]MBE7659628.1 AAA family ATPase [Tenacibaculum finnmarkense genomovar finnmarkense]MCG8252702.1 AAA family ATPase [Tenacibaculum finnmarkense genomovar finnmarkense]MCG8814487.1 ATP-binding protein [Tenacibaculum finnmarkense]MCG8819507.1 ATP-binding protein [Tenacibaculum finnmarkense]
MEKSKLLIENFGPIKKALIDIKDMLLFIGPQSSGKSTLAKLITILNDFNFKQNENIKLVDELKKYNLESFLKSNTKIEYKTLFFNFTYSKNEEIKLDYESYYKSLKLENKNLKRKKILVDLMIISIAIDDKLSLLFDELYKNSFFGINQKLEKINFAENFLYVETILECYNMDTTDLNVLEHLFDVVSKVFPFIRPMDSMYIPAERMLLPLINSNLAGLINNKINIPNHIIQATQEFEKAIQNVESIDLNIIGDLKYKRKAGTSYIYHNRSQKIQLKEASSGVQSVLPILLLIESSLQNKNYINLNYVVEEPELNLYPQAQYELIKYLVKNCLETGENNLKSKNLIITTHSPYILTAINNLLLANSKGKTNKNEVEEIINSSSWINPEKFNAYEVKDGTVKKIFNSEIKLIEETIIDEVSELMIDDFKDLASIV